VFCEWLWNFSLPHCILLHPTHYTLETMSRNCLEVCGFTLYTSSQLLYSVFFFLFFFFGEKKNVMSKFGPCPMISSSSHWHFGPESLAKNFWQIFLYWLEHWSWGPNGIIAVVSQGNPWTICTEFCFAASNVWMAVSLFPL